MKPQVKWLPFFEPIKKVWFKYYYFFAVVFFHFNCLIECIAFEFHSFGTLKTIKKIHGKRRMLNRKIIKKKTHTKIPYDLKAIELKVVKNCRYFSCRPNANIFRFDRT